MMIYHEKDLECELQKEPSFQPESFSYGIKIPATPGAVSELRMNFVSTDSDAPIQAPGLSDSTGNTGLSCIKR